MKLELLGGLTLIAAIVWGLVLLLSTEPVPDHPTRYEYPYTAHQFLTDVGDHAEGYCRQHFEPDKDVKTADGIVKARALCAEAIVTVNDQDGCALAEGSWVCEDARDILRGELCSWAWSGNNTLEPDQNSPSKEMHWWC